MKVSSNRLTPFRFIFIIANISMFGGAVNVRSWMFAVIFSLFAVIDAVLIDVERIKIAKKGR